jgi:hypothetical protein
VTVAVIKALNLGILVTCSTTVLPLFAFRSNHQLIWPKGHYRGVSYGAPPSWMLPALHIKGQQEQWQLPCIQCPFKMYLHWQSFKQKHVLLCVFCLLDCPVFLWQCKIICIFSLYCTSHKVAEVIRETVFGISPKICKVCSLP